VLVAYDTPLQERTVSLPPLSGSQVLVKTIASGLCHSDLHFLSGEVRPKPAPIVVGHEVAGEVIAVGPDAKLKVGSKVVVWPWFVLDKVKQYSYSLGIQVDGGFSTHVVVPEDRFCLPFGNIPIQQACILACSGITSYSALKAVQSNLTQGGKRHLVIIGAGGLGLQAVRFCREMMGISPIVCDIDNKKLQTAKKLGPEGTFTINTSDMPKALEDIGAFTGGTGCGPDAIIDFVGTSDTIQFGLTLLSRKVHRAAKGKFVLVGLYGGAIDKKFIPIIIRNRVIIEGVYTGSLEDLQELLSLVQKSGQDFPVREEELKLNNINQAISDMKKGTIIGRVVFRSKL